MEWFKQGGTMMFAVLAFDGLAATLWVLATVAAAVAFVGAIPRAVLWVLCGLTLLAGFGAAAAGVLGWQIGMAQVNSALQMVAPEHRAELLVIGSAEAAVSMRFGLWSLAVVGVATLLPLGLTALGKRLPTEEPRG